MEFFEKVGNKRNAKKNLARLAKKSSFAELAKSANDFTEANVLTKDCRVELKFFCQNGFEVFCKQLDKINA